MSLPRITRRGFLKASAIAVGGWYGSHSSQLFAANTWADTRSHGPFTCYGDFPLEPLTHLFDELDALQRELIRTLAIEPAKRAIELYVFREQKTHEDYLAKLFPKVPYRRALFVKTGVVERVFVYQHDELDIDVRHECTHALLHASQPMVPLWLDEGLAEYFELPQNKRAFDNPHFDAVCWNMRLGIVQTLDSLEKKKDLSEMGAKEYRFSWAWAHYMLHGPREAHRELVHFLSDIRNGTPPGELSKRLTAAIPNVEQRFVEHFKQWKKQA